MTSFKWFLTILLLSIIFYVTASHIKPSNKNNCYKNDRFALHSYTYEEDGTFKMQVIDNRNKVKYYYKCQTIPFTKKEIEEDFMQVVIWERPENVKYIKD